MQPALQDEPRRSRGVLGRRLAENRPKPARKSEFRIANEPLRPVGRRVRGGGVAKATTRLRGTMAAPAAPACAGQSTRGTTRPSGSLAILNSDFGLVLDNFLPNLAPKPL